MRDVVVIGAGHNALVAACYLAREGFDVEVVERDTIVGGAVSTVERFPGYRVDRGSSAHIMIRHTGIIEELRLAEAGLRYVDCDPWAFAPFDDSALTFWRDLDRTCESIEATCGPQDADAYSTFVRDWGARNRLVFDAFQRPPTARSLGEPLLRLGRITRSPGGELARQFLQPADALLDSYFGDERLKTALSWLGAQSGPPGHEVATADLVGWNALLHDVSPGRPIGGSGELSRALARRFASYGGRLRVGDGAQRITTYRGEVTGVLTASGEHIAASRVVAGCHILTTLGLLGDDDLLARSRARIRVGNGIGMAVRLGTNALPEYAAGAGNRNAHHGLQLLARSREQLRAAHGDFAAGRPPRDPAVLAMTFSAVDASIAPAGRHNVTLWGQWHPYALSTGESWDDIGSREADKLINAVDTVAPGFAHSIEHVFVQTPLDIERELGLVHGNVMHVEMGFDAMFALRPTPEWAHYRGPARNLYLTGASTHPGGGVFGASGRAAAHTVIRDWRPGGIRRLLRHRWPVVESR